MPQPNFVPVSLRTSRRYHNRGMLGSPSKLRSTPFTLSLIIRRSFCRSRALRVPPKPALAEDKSQLSFGSLRKPARMPHSRCPHFDASVESRSPELCEQFHVAEDARVQWQASCTCTKVAEARPALAAPIVFAKTSASRRIILKSNSRSSFFRALGFAILSTFLAIWLHAQDAQF